MIPPPLPPDEPERLASLRSLGLLDTDAEERFDRITRLAQVLFDVPIALISLVDADRQWFKSRQGLETVQTPRAVSFCGHAILGAEIFEIPDAMSDARFRDNPLVTGEPNLRFYAGVPLAAPDGRRIGTLCLVDLKPRELTPVQRQGLKELAAFAEHEMTAAAPAARGGASAEAARRMSRDRWIRTAFAAAAALMLSAAVVSYRSVHVLVETARRADRAHETLRDLDAVLARSGGPGGRETSGSFAVLRGLLADEPEQLRRLDAVERLAAVRSRGSLDAAVAEMEAAERRLLTELDGRVDSRARMLLLAASFARGVGLLVILLAFLAVRRYVGERDRAEAALTGARDAALLDAEARRSAQEETRRLSERLRAVLDQMDSGVVLTETSGNIALFNRAAERIHGAWRGEFERVMRAGTHPPLRADGKTPLAPGEDPTARALKGETVRDARVFLRTPFRPNGYAIIASAAPMRSPQGLVTGAVLIFREVEGASA